MATVISYGAAVDCGMFQGREEHRNYGPFDFDATEVDYLLVTHAHLDHVGRIPKLLKEGFDGTLVATEATLALAEVVLLDSAKLMKEDYLTRYKKAQRRGTEHTVPQPLYEVKDVEKALALPKIIPEYDKPFELCEGVTVTYRNAGHILGSAYIEIDYEENGQKRKIVFSGDIGNDNDTGAMSLFLPLPLNVRRRYFAFSKRCMTMESCPSARSSLTPQWRQRRLLSTKSTQRSF